MKIIPSERIEIISSFTIEEVKRVLDDNIQPKVRFNFTYPNKHRVFEGFYEDNIFEIQRIIRGRNSFIPKIKGKLSSHENGSKLMATFKMNQFVIIFMIIWLGFVGVGFFVALGLVISENLNPFIIVGPFVMMIFGFGLMNYGFNSEKKKAVKALEKILKAKAHSTVSNTRL